jgi:hypothetical protein
MRCLARLLVVAGVWLVSVLPAQAAWLRAESQNFIVYAESSEPDLRETVAQLEDYRHLLRMLMRTEAPPSSKVRVYLVRGSDELQTVRELPREAAGVYISGADGIVAVANMRGGLGDPLSVLFHEYAHHFMMQHQGRVFPAWYVEGFAEFMMTARFTDRTIEFGRVDAVRAQTLADLQRWLPLEQVLSGEGRRPDRAHFFYAQSWLLTHYLLNDPQRRQQLQAYVTALGRAEDPRRAFEASFGMTPERMQPLLTRYALGGLTFMRLPRTSTTAPPQVQVERMPASADALLLLDAAVHVGLRDKGERLARIRREAARFPDPFAKRVLAQVEALYGNGAVAGPLLNDLLAADPDKAELMYLQGMRHLVAGRQMQGQARTAAFREARAWLARAHRADPKDFRAPYRYVETFSVEPNLVSPKNVEVLLLAHTLAPQVGEVRFAAAQMLVALGDYELAETLLQPLVGTAHEGAHTARARELMAKARSRTNAGIRIAFSS